MGFFIYNLIRIFRKEKTIMNIMEIKKYLHTNNEFHSDDLIEYVNQRLERRNSHSYKMSLFI